MLEEYSSMDFIFTQLCKHLHNLILEHFIILKRNLVPISSNSLFPICFFKQSQTIGKKGKFQKR